MMNHELLQRALADIRASRDKNGREEARRLEEVTKACPEIGALVEERRAAILTGLRQALEGNVPQGIEEQTARRNARITQLLKAKGYGADYLSPVYDCELCQDSGYAGESKKTLCRCAVSLYQQLSLGSAFQDESQTFENYDETVFPTAIIAGEQVSQRSYVRLIKEQCESYADSLPEGKLQNLLLYGGSGLGKTYLLRSIAHRAGRRGVQALALTANSLLNLIRKQYFSREESEDAPYMSVPLLLIDDLGTEPLWENITVEQLFALIDHRLTMGLHTVISTNLSLTELRSRYTERIMSRLLDNRLCKKLAFMGRDIRLIR